MLRKYKKIQQKTCQYDKKIVNLDIRGKKSRKRKGDFMKKKAGIWAVAAAIMTIMSATAAAAEKDPVLFTFNGKDVFQSELVQRTAAYAQGGMISSDTAYREAIEYMIENQLVAEAKAAELGLDQYTDEELEALRKEADEYYEQQLDALVTYYEEQNAAELSDEEKAEFREQLKTLWEEIGTTKESAEETHIFNKTRDRLLETMEVENTEEEIQQVFEEQIEKDRTQFEDNVRMYEYFTYYQNYDVWYTPEGFRKVQQILLKVDDELTDAYKKAADSEEGVEEAKEAILSARQDTVDEIYKKLEDGAEFKSLMEEYSEDPGLDEDMVENGYLVHQESAVWGAEFAEGAFSDKMQKTGDVSDPVVSKYGIQILYYLSDVPSGPVEMSDPIHESIEKYLTSQKQANMLKDWVEEYEVTYNEEALKALEEAVPEATAETQHH